MIKCLAIIPARGGSKRIPRKNIRNFAGQPIIGYSINAAVDSRCFDEVMVSTDDSEIAKIAKSFGAHTPFFRSKETSGDDATTVSVLEEAIGEYKKLGREFDYICCVYPTAPFITKERLKLAKKSIIDKKAEGVIVVMRSSHPIQKALKLSNGRVSMFWPKNYNIRSQDLEPSYFDSNQFYFLKTRSFLKQKTLYPRFTVALETSELEAQDINNEADWKIAEAKFKFLNKK